jgi:predicted glutamine amidotransferase
MCGLIYVKRKDKRPAYKSVLKRYRAQKGRGTEGYGYVAVENDKVIRYKRADNEKEIIDHLVKETASEILFHHRSPTGSPNVEELAHPIQVENAMLEHQYYVAHNGVIRNDSKLKGEHEALGFQYNTEIVRGFTAAYSGKNYSTGISWNDSEAIAIETALALDGKQNKINAKGAAAVIGLKTKNGHVVDRFFYRNNLNPLKYHEDRVMIALTSAGKGNFVKTIYVQRLKPGGGFDDYGNKIFTPSGYENQYTKDDGSVKRWDEDAKAWVYENDDGTHTLALPSPPMGFRQTVVNKSMRSIDEVLKDLQKIPTYFSPMPLIRGYTESTLWAEFDKTIGAETDLKKRILDLDITSENYIDAEVLNERKFLQDALDKNKRYQDALSNEITIRESKVPA